MALGKLTIVIGAGIIGTVLSKDGQLSDVTKFFSGAFKIVTRHLKQDNSQSTSKPQTDSLLAQVNTLREELQILASSRSVTIITGGGPGSARFGVTTVIVVGALGFVFIWWKGWKLSDLMFVTRRGFSDTCNRIGRQLDLVSSSVSAARRHLSSKIDHVDSNLEECKELATATKLEVSELNGDLSLVCSDIESVQCAVETLRSKLDRIEGTQDSPQRTIEFPQITAVTALSLTPLSTESVSLSESPLLSIPSTPHGNPRVLHSSAVVSTSGLKDLQGFSNTTKQGNSKVTISPGNTSKVSNGTTTEQCNSSAPPSSSRSLWKFPSINILSRNRNAIS
ncbi:hypothetical protein ZIOFF_033537 [Zingiber officinale]|uniref:DUF1664 domain-containing protein n=1 Tax=Zingiber officinale TaxID=94328 RepID=A0A8J5GJY6_ZINOF|nr:hypothetical protein ZIOFF_033537 [Zingiber officinale]